MRRPRLRYHDATSTPSTRRPHADGANGTEGFDDKIPKDATLIYTLELKSLLPFAPTDAQQKWIAENPNPWDK